MFPSAASTYVRMYFRLASFKVRARTTTKIVDDDDDVVVGSSSSFLVLDKVGNMHSKFSFWSMSREDSSCVRSLHVIGIYELARSNVNLRKIFS